MPAGVPIRQIRLLLATNPRLRVTIALLFIFRALVVAQENVALAVETSSNAALQNLPRFENSAVIESSPLYSIDNFEQDPADDLGAELSMEDRLRKLETQYDNLGGQYGDLQDDLASLKQQLKTAAFSGHDKATMKVNGRVNIDHAAFPGDVPGINVFENGDPDITPQDRFGFRRLRFGVRGKVWNTMVYRVEMELARGNKSEFRDAYLGWNELPLLHTLLIGNQKRPYGLDYINSSRYNVFLERPFVIEAINQDARRFGIQSYGVSENERWNWRYGVFNLKLIQDDGNYTGDHYQLELAGRLANTFWYDKATDGRNYGHWAIAATTADPDGSNFPGQATNEARFRTRPEARSVNRWIDTGVIDGADNYGVLGLENVWNFGPLQLVGEYQDLWLDRNGGSDLRFHGGYVYAAYFLTGEHMPWDPRRGALARIVPLENFFLTDTGCDGIRGGWGAWQVAYRWSYADFTDDDILGGIGKSHTLGLNWYWNAYARMQFNAIYGEIDDHEGFDNSDPPVSLGALSGHYTSLGTRLMLDY